MELNNDQRLLAEENMKLAYKRANRWMWLDFEKEDIISASLLGLTKAAGSYDRSKGCSFSTLCYRVIDNEIFKMMRKNNADKRTAVLVSLDQDVRNTPIQELIGEEDEYLSENESFVQYLIGSLPENEKEIIELYFFKKLTQFEIAELYNVSQTHVSRTIRSSIDKMRIFYKE